VSFLNHAERVRSARKALADLGRKHGGRPFEGWPADDRARYVSAETTLRQLGEEP
jgi:hypothetical protein